MSNLKILGKLKKTKPSDREKEIISLLLKNRDISSKKDQEFFFNPYHPLMLKLKDLGIEEKEVLKAVTRIVKAVKESEPIIIYGDYDADGICGTAILWETLFFLKAKVVPYLPHRIKEGYGLSKKGIDKILKEYQARLVISVDHGVTARKEIEYAKKKGIEVIITDHHVLPKNKPKPFALVHSTKISGASVVWFLAREILRAGITKRTLRWFDGLLNDEMIKEKLSLAAIGTVSDVLPLLGVNRAIVIHGLEEMRKTKRPGLIALCKEAGIKPSQIDSYHLGFIIGPRINATGRITHALDSLRLLCTRSNIRAYELAKILGLTNKQRQRLTEETLSHAKSYLEKELKTEKSKLIFISHSSYNQGIIGLVAGKLVEEFYKPAIVVSEGKIFSKASARSINGFNIIEAIRQSSQFLVNCGGHPMAAGFTVETAKIEILRKKLQEVVDKNLSNDLLVKPVKVDCEITLSDITLSLFEKIEKFKPFGLGNPEPLFFTRDLKVLEVKFVGKERKHLKLKVSDKEGKEFQAIAFEKGDLLRHSGSGESIFSQFGGSKINLVYNLTKNDWDGERLELKIKEIIFI